MRKILKESFDLDLRMTINDFISGIVGSARVSIRDIEDDWGVGTLIIKDGNIWKKQYFEYFSYEDIQDIPVVEFSVDNSGQLCVYCVIPDDIYMKYEIEEDDEY